jgi:hypothetical protein
MRRREPIGRLEQGSVEMTVYAFRSPCGAFDFCHRRRSGFFGRSQKLLPEEFRPKAPA